MLLRRLFRGDGEKLLENIEAKGERESGKFWRDELFFPIHILF